MLGRHVERLLTLEERVAPTLESMGFEIVRIALTKASGDGHRTLQVMADRLDGTLIAIEDCEVISQTLSAIFDVEDPVSGAYDLEVSSAGIDRPLTRPKDFTTYAGFEAKVETKLAINGRKRFKGPVNGLAENGDVMMMVDGANVNVPFENISQAKLVLTNALIAATAKGRPISAEKQTTDKKKS
jgi:ribosome maturation factor RimP